MEKHKNLSNRARFKTLCFGPQLFYENVWLSPAGETSHVCNAHRMVTDAGTKKVAR